MKDFIARCRAAIGETYVLTHPSDTEHYFREYGGRYQGNGLAVLRPANTQQVSELVTLCAQHGVAIVPQGGNTGLVGGSVPYNENAVVISLSRMNAIRHIDADDFSITVDAGCLLSVVQNAAQDVNRYFPLRLGAQESCTIGGNIAANAGGILTLRYGNCRDLVLGLEVVLPDGQVWNGLRSLRKDNTGYALKHLFIGSEGTLGIITAATLKLYPDPGQRETVLAAVQKPQDFIALLSLLRRDVGDAVSAFEIMSQQGVEFACDYNPNCVYALPADTPWTVLIETTHIERHVIEDFLAMAFEHGLVTDAILAQNEQQQKDFWKLRECMSDGAQARPGGSIKHDISVPINAIPDFLDRVMPVIERVIPGVLPVVFGHAGDGNLHVDLTIPHTMSVDDFRARWSDVNHAVHDVVQAFNGSFAAEHGVGAFKAGELAVRKSTAEMMLMGAIKGALDPDGRMNPEAIFSLKTK